MTIFAQSPVVHCTITNDLCYTKENKNTVGDMLSLFHKHFPSTIKNLFPAVSVQRLSCLDVSKEWGAGVS